MDGHFPEKAGGDSLWEDGKIFHEIVYEEDAQEIPVVEETRVTSSDFDKIKVTGMHQVTMQEAAAEEPYEEIPVEELTSAANLQKTF